MAEILIRGKTPNIQLFNLYFQFPIPILYLSVSRWTTVVYFRKSLVFGRIFLELLCKWQGHTCTLVKLSTVSSVQVKQILIHQTRIYMLLPYKNPQNSSISSVVLTYNELSVTCNRFTGYLDRVKSFVLLWKKIIFI